MPLIPCVLRDYTQQDAISFTGKGRIPSYTFAVEVHSSGLDHREQPLGLEILQKVKLRRVLWSEALPEAHWLDILNAASISYCG